MRKSGGNSLIQYLFILALIAGVVTPIYFTFGDTISSNLLSLLESQETNNAQMKMNANNITNNNFITGDILAGQLGGTPEIPVRVCKNNNCSIDFGPIILNNIPQNYTELIETTGAHGTTDSVLTMVEQVASQLENNPDISEEHLDKINNLISSGKQIVAIEAEFERKYDNFLNYKDKLVEYSDIMEELWDKKLANSISKEEFEIERSRLTKLYETYIDQYNQDIHGLSTITLNDQTYQISLWDNFVLLNPEATIKINNDQLLAYQEEYKFDLDSYDKYLNQDNKSLNKENLTPVGEYLKELKLILEDKNVPPEIHQVTESLSKEIFDISQVVRQNIDNFGLHLTSYNPEYAYNRNLYDARLGGDPRFQNAGDTIFDIVTNNNQKPSQTTRIDLNIICTTNRGKYNSQQDKCGKH